MIEKEGKALGEILSEYQRARKKHAPTTSARAMHSIIEEEYDEFWDALKADDYEHAREEIVQLGAMCLAYLIEVETK